MGLLTLPFQLPFLPLTGLIALGEVLYDQAEQELHDPAAVRRQLEEAEEARLEGSISDQEVGEAESEAVGRLVGPGRKRR
jgi:hypothetical protein